MHLWRAPYRYSHSSQSDIHLKYKHAANLPVNSFENTTFEKLFSQPLFSCSVNHFYYQEQNVFNLLAMITIETSQPDRESNPEPPVVIFYPIHFYYSARCCLGI